MGQCWQPKCSRITLRSIRAKDWAYNCCKPHTPKQGSQDVSSARKRRACQAQRARRPRSRCCSVKMPPHITSRQKI